MWKAHVVAAGFYRIRAYSGLSGSTEHRVKYEKFTNRRHTNVTMITCLMSKKIQLRSCGKPQHGLFLQKKNKVKSLMSKIVVNDEEF